ncbi:MAG: acyltransferase [Candidatus Methanofastidiosa archaeon]|nr:acyltransferase [Candidatus Methanofastidiosa archaeon]
MKRIFSKLIAIPKSFLICWKLFGIKKAFQLPMIVAVGFAVKAKKGQVTIDPKSRVLLGFETWMAPSKNSESSLQIDDGFVKFQGVARIGSGSCIKVEPGGELIIGNNFESARNVFICVSKNIILGDDVLVGYNSSIRDDDGHGLMSDSVNRKKIPVIIGNNCWIGSHCHLLKGAVLREGNVVATGSIVTSSTKSQANSVIGGAPARVIKNNIFWRK